MPSAGGTGYAVGDTLQVIDNAGTGEARVTVAAVNAGVVTELALASGGTDLYFDHGSWNTKDLTTPSATGCTVVITSVNPIHFTNPAAAFASPSTSSPLTDSNGNLQYDLTYYDVPNQTLYFKPGSPIMDLDTELHIVSSASQFGFFAQATPGYTSDVGYITLRGIFFHYGAFGIHIGQAYGGSLHDVTIDSNRIESVLQGILIGMTKSTIENNYVDKLGGLFFWNSSNQTYRRWWLHHGMYVNGDSLTIKNNFFGRSRSGFGIQETYPLNNSVFDGNITYDNIQPQLMLQGSNNHITNHIALSRLYCPHPTCNPYELGSDTAVELTSTNRETSSSQLSRRGKYLATAFFATSPNFNFHNNTVNTVPNTYYGYSINLNLPGNGDLEPGLTMNSNTWMGTPKWNVAVTGTGTVNTTTLANFVSEMLSVFN